MAKEKAERKKKTEILGDSDLDMEFTGMMPPQIEEGEEVFKKCASPIASLLRDCQAQTRWFAMSTKEGAHPDPGGMTRGKGEKKTCTR